MTPSASFPPSLMARCLVALISMTSYNSARLSLPRLFSTSRISSPPRAGRRRGKRIERRLLFISLPFSFSLIESKHDAFYFGSGERGEPATGCQLSKRENKAHVFSKTSPRNGGLKVFLPIRGTESEVAGMISATSNINTVRDSSTVMPEGDKHADTSAETQRIPSFITV